MKTTSSNLLCCRMAMLALACCLGLGTAEAQSQSPVGLLLTWQHDPTTTMTIDWHRGPDQLDQPPILEVRERGSEAWASHQATRFDFPFSNQKVDRVEVTGLTPDTAYEFRSGQESPVYYFRTMPKDLSKPLTFVIGGDMSVRMETNQMNRAVLGRDPAFIVWGGDIWYEDGKPENAARVQQLFGINMETLIASDGRVIPILACIGNHEVDGGYHNDRMINQAARVQFAPYFYSLFAFPGDPGYGVLDFGNYLSLVFSDSEHTNPIEGKQTAWLSGVLATRERVPYLLPIHHVPAYPSARLFDNPVSVLVREHWSPLFDQFGVLAVFEHHDHTYKRTPPIRAGKADPEGVVYLGDGAWGVGTRKVHLPEETWYLEKAESKNHAFVVTLTKETQTVEAIAMNGEVFDKVSFPARTAPARD